MNSPQPQPDSSKLDAYLDGQLPPEERDAAAREIAASRELQREVELQSQIDAALRQSFAPPAMPSELVAKLRDAAKVRPEFATTSSTARAKPRNWKLIAAITTAAAIVWGYLGWQFLAPDPNRPDYNPRSRSMRFTLRPSPKASSPSGSAKTTPSSFARSKSARGKACLGLGRNARGDQDGGPNLRRRHVALHNDDAARVDDKPVMVFVDRADSDYRPAQPCGSCGLHLFSKQVGSLMLYELTPLDQPKLMDYLRLPDEKSPPPSDGAGAR